MRSVTAAVVAALVLLPATPAWAANQAPVAADDAVNLRTTAAGQQVHALGNDTDPDGDRLTYIAVTPATKGTAYIDTVWPHYLKYRPQAGATEGTDSFTYTVSDGNGNTATATVTVTLWAALAAPTGLTITSAGPDAVTLTWSAVPNATSYRVHGYGSASLETTTTALTMTATGLVWDSGSYFYAVSAINGGGFEGPWSASVHRAPRLSTPDSLVVDITGHATSLSLDWYGTSGTWNVYRDGGLVASTSVSEFEDTGLVAGQEYSYQVQRTAPPRPDILYPPSALTAPVSGSPVELSAIGWLFRDLGWTTGTLGAVTVAERAIPGGRQQDHENGVILQQDGEEPLAVTGSLATDYLVVGGAGGYLGFPIAEQESGLRDGGIGQLFENGSIWDSPSTSTAVVRQVMEDRWAASGWEDGPLGYPLSWEGRLRHGGRHQIFEGGDIYWTPTTGARIVSGAILNAWHRLRRETGRLGYPTSDETTTAGTRKQTFRGGTITVDIATGRVRFTYR